MIEIVPFFRGDRLGPFGEREGFTLIELLLVLSLLGILATSVEPKWFAGSEKIYQNAEKAVAGNIQTGIYLYGNESMVAGREPVYPPTLDEATLGASSPSNGFFAGVLSSTVSRDWVKEGNLTYRGPTGQLYNYDPNRGLFLPTDALNADGGAPTNPWGLILDTFGDIVFYSSGAIIDQKTSLAYLPDYLTGTVGLTLVSGITIETNEDGSATVTFPDGETMTVDDVNGQWVTYRLPGENGEETTYFAVGGGQAYEWEGKNRVLKEDSSYDRSTKSYQYETVYESEGRQSGGSLKTEQGFIYESNWESKEPTIVQSSYTPGKKGSYEGTTEYSYHYATDATYAFNSDQGANRQAYGFNSEVQGASQTTYSYDSKTGVYKDQYKGTIDYQVGQNSLKGKGYENRDAYEYEGEYKQNRKTGDYEGSIRYKHQDGRDYTYEYRYDHKTKTYSQTYHDNRSDKSDKSDKSDESDESDESDRSDKSDLKLLLKMLWAFHAGRGIVSPKSV